MCGPRERRSKNALFVLAHQDDEVFLSTRIERERRSGHVVWCAFLTDGRARGADSARRNAESRRVLGRLAVDPDHVLFAGSEQGIPDGDLPHHLEASLGVLSGRLAGVAVERVYTTAYEGGHQDHDAAHLVALAFAGARGLIGRTWQAPTYNGFRMPWRLFRVQQPLAGPRRRCIRRLDARAALHHALLPAHYPSQWSAWMGLWPGLALERLALRRETLLAVDLARARRRPHEGPLLYERRTAWTYAAFATAAAPFIAHHLTEIVPLP